ncbi:hypothetical protein LN040_05040 [Desulfovibrio subterraneus]|jgi:hypothetical protein|uniref:Uncharacterized protein n=1 Tax=Desulfovibrio subterraneus TaxID=2718620 RepID=A0A7J0BMH4_9BACT|nr:hypothetical protein [Desulfovibrio subterraneus]WBF68472.1 hypothetical protein LN040_05040 [Desulfovibrio subterraneus]GFM34431.1 hypothetical protein DSM101010T_27960 [Desulfovibrio subterraneus]
MLKLDFTTTGYIIMCLIWSLAGIIGAVIAHKKGRSPFFWGILCLIAPLALFAIGGMRAPGEPLPPIFQREKEELERLARERAEQQSRQ